MEAINLPLLSLILKSKLRKAFYSKSVFSCFFIFSVCGRALLMIGWGNHVANHDVLSLSLLKMKLL